MVIPRRHDFSICRKDILDSSAQQLFTLVRLRSGIFALYRKLWSYYVINLTMLKPSSFFALVAGAVVEMKGDEMTR